MTRDANLSDHWWIAGTGTFQLIAGSHPIALITTLEISANSLYQIESLKAEVHADQAKLLTTLEGLSSYKGQLSAKIGEQSIYYDSSVPGPLQLVKTSANGFGLKLPFSEMGLATSQVVLRRLHISPGLCDQTVPLEVQGLLSTFKLPSHDD